MYGYRAVLVLVGLWLSACTSVRDVSKDAFDEELAEALCERDVRCGRYGSKTDCKHETLHRLIPEAGIGQKYEASLAEGRTRYDANAAGECLERLRSASCAERLPSRRIQVGSGPREPVLSFGVVDECRFLLGTVADGGYCQSMADCGPNSFCTSVIDKYGCEGVCTPRTGKGEAFSASSVCAPGLISGETNCDELVRGDEGQRCDHLSQRCKSGLYCSSDSVCRRYAAAGESCGLEGEEPWCAWPLVCLNGTCRERGGEESDCTGVSLAYWGEFAENFWSCQLDFFCDAEPASPGKCRKLLTEGASCRAGPECGADLYCSGANPTTQQRGTCQRGVRQPGELCERSSQCASPATCVGHTCTTYAACGPAGP